MHADEPETFFDLLIIDDIVPSDFSPFRTREYGHYLSFFNSAVLSLEGWHLWLENRSFEDHRASFPVDEPLKARILQFAANRDIGGRLAYITFLGNARRPIAGSSRTTAKPLSAQRTACHPQIWSVTRLPKRDQH